MSVARHHLEWMQLIEVSGPFLSLPVLLRIFPNELDAADRDGLKNLKTAYEEWLDNQRGLSPHPAIHKEWIRYVLKETLGWSRERLGLSQDLIKTGPEIPSALEANFAEHHEIIRPDFILCGPNDPAKPEILISFFPADQNLEKPVSGREWKASPAVRMMELCHSCDVALGLVTNGEQWMLVYAPRGETTSFVTWYADLWFAEDITLRAFRSLLCPRRIFGVVLNDRLAALFEESESHQQDVTDQLGYQVRSAVELLVQAIDREDKDRDRQLLNAVSEREIYEASLTIMMRLVFLFCAEERGLLLKDDPLYDEHYAISTLRNQLRELADKFGEEILERRHDAWCRLLAVFRAVYGGMNHDRLRLPAYGGRLFDPDRFPFLEGRQPGSSWKDSPSDPLPVNNRTVLHLLSSLQVLQVKLPGGGPSEARRLSFRALDVEQIGHVYEGLLDHSAIRATEPILGLKGSKDQEEEIPLSKIAAEYQKGRDSFAEYLKGQTGRSQKAITREMDSLPLVDSAKLRAACDNDEALIEKIMPFANLLRVDSSGYPVVITPQSLYVTQCSDRRTTGTHYTPRSLTEPIVRYTLEPLVYEGPKEGKPKTDWKLKSARELIGLKICDMAMGSGAFLVQACRYMADCLASAWEDAENNADGRLVISPEGDLSTGDPHETPIPQDQEERLSIARRIISERCLYGVDKNPMAAEMAKLSLWLTTAAKGKPFTFLDHCFKCGDSLVGVDKDQLDYWSLERGTTVQDNVLNLFVNKDLKKSIALRKALENLPAGDIRNVEHKARLHKEAEGLLKRLRLAGDLIAAPEFCETTKAKKEDQREDFQARFIAFNNTDFDADLEKESRAILGELAPFHWPAEFPEVFLDNDDGGFDAIIGNPPFIGGQRIRGALGVPYRDFLVSFLAGGKKGSADLCAYFFLRAGRLLKAGGNMGLLATNTIAQGDTREVGLEQLAESGFSIPRAVASRKWPGTANLEVAHVWLHKGKWQGGHTLEDEPVTGITPFLSVPGKVLGAPYRLKANEGKSFQGSIPLGKGFLLTPAQANQLIVIDKKNESILKPYISGDDILTRPEQEASRWVIDFGEMDIENARQFTIPFSILHELVLPIRKNDNRKIRKEKWWQFAERAITLYNSISNLENVIFHSFTGKYIAFSYINAKQIFAGPHVVIASDAFSLFCLLQSSFHYIWVLKWCSTHETRIRYAPSDLFETFPFPVNMESLSSIGNSYCEYRNSIMLNYNFGLTGMYNMFHDFNNNINDINIVRNLQIKMDNAVLEAYGWTDLSLNHDFYETAQGMRFTICEKARVEILDRLLALNHQRYAEEIAQGLHETKKASPANAKAGKSKKAKPAQEDRQYKLPF